MKDISTTPIPIITCTHPSHTFINTQVSHPLLNWVLARQDFETRTQFSSGWDKRSGELELFKPSTQQQRQLPLPLQSMAQRPQHWFKERDVVERLVIITISSQGAASDSHTNFIRNFLSVIYSFVLPLVDCLCTPVNTSSVQ